MQNFKDNQIVFLLKDNQGQLQGDLLFHIKNEDGKFVLSDHIELKKKILIPESFKDGASLKELWNGFGNPFPSENFHEWCYQCLFALNSHNIELANKQFAENDFYKPKTFAGFMLEFAVYLQENEVDKEKWIEIMKPHICYEFDSLAKYIKFTENN